MIDDWEPTDPYYPLPKPEPTEPDEEYTPRQLIDRRLDSLRRQRQHQLNEVEREQLKKQIREYQKDMERKHLWGIKDNLKWKRKQQLMEMIRKKRKVAKDLKATLYLVNYAKKGTIHEDKVLLIEVKDVNESGILEEIKTKMSRTEFKIFFRKLNKECLN